ncbi:MAG: class I SAM-dependent methyltransferase [Pseudomonadota bacterium]|nr:class I SAM-dependent methyltransferase [Pseudomonadota bacterium]
MRDAVSPQKLKSVYAAVARRYDLQHGLLTLHRDERGRELVVEQAVRRGDRVLDAGGGTGSTTLLAAKKAGPEGHVTQIDFSPQMQAVAQQRTREGGLDGRIDFRSGDMLALPFADESFDSVLSTYSLCPLFDPAKGALELYRVLKPGGRLGLAHSASPENPVMYWLAERLEDVLWYFPGVSMGCRAVSVLPALQHAGARLLFERHLGVPLYPFVVLVLEKPGAAGSGGPS